MRERPWQCSVCAEAESRRGPVRPGPVACRSGRLGVPAEVPAGAPFVRACSVAFPGAGGGAMTMAPGRQLAVWRAGWRPASAVPQPGAQTRRSSGCRPAGSTPARAPCAHRRSVHRSRREHGAGTCHLLCSGVGYPGSGRVTAAGDFHFRRNHTWKRSRIRRSDLERKREEQCWSVTGSMQQRTSLRNPI